MEGVRAPFQFFMSPTRLSLDSNMLSSDICSLKTYLVGEKQIEDPLSPPSARLLTVSPAPRRHGTLKSETWRPSLLR